MNKKKTSKKDAAKTAYPMEEMTSERGDAPGRSSLNKSELSLIFLGAGLVTVIVFFIMFKPTSSEVSETKEAETAVQSLEQRLTVLEQRLVDQLESEDLTPGTGKAQPSLDTYAARVKRVEAALSMKFDILAKRMDRIDRRIEGIEQKQKKLLLTSNHNKPVAAKSVPKKVSAPTAKKSGTTQTKAPVLHQVKKGETLYSISKRYNITVDRLRRLNKLSKTAAIFPGDNLVIR